MMTEEKTSYRFYGLVIRGERGWFQTSTARVCVDSAAGIKSWLRKALRVGLGRRATSPSSGSEIHLSAFRRHHVNSLRREHFSLSWSKGAWRSSTGFRASVRSTDQQLNSHWSSRPGCPCSDDRSQNKPAPLPGSELRPVPGSRSLREARSRNFPAPRGR